MIQYTKYTFFFRDKSPFSNWYPAKFIVDNIEYNCVEQYMMAEKAKLFNDQTIREMILIATNPRDQKALGRKVSNFDTEKWNKVAKQIVYKGCYYKFTQNPKLMLKLLETKGTLLVEASPYDTIWGIGLGENDPRRLDKNKWRGTNWLGIVLTKLRENLEVS